VVDWFEWQAGYASGALLMPESFARRTVEAYFQNRSERPPVAKGSPEASVLCQRISLAFDVSVEAATVRLSQLGCLTK
jgi:Zn-dependent peptidase ImmA (M78 family)